MTSLPPPLVPLHVDLRAIAPFMPLDVVRLRDSDIANCDDPEGFRAAVLLWCAAWHQVPAGSIPGDERVIARLAGYGRDIRGWNRIKSVAMKGFVQCDDGRFYHHVVSEKAIETWTKLNAKREQTRAARAAVGKKKPKQNNESGATNRHLDTTTNRAANGAQDSINDNATAVDRNRPKGEERIGEDRKKQDIATAIISEEDQRWAELSTKICDLYDRRGSQTYADTNWVTIWRKAGYDVDLCITVIRDVLANSKQPKDWCPSLKYYEEPLRKAHAKVREAQGASNGVAKAPAIDWDRVVKAFVDSGGQIWFANQSPRPGYGGCQVPREVIDKYREQLQALGPAVFPTTH